MSLIAAGPALGSGPGVGTAAQWICLNRESWTIRLAAARCALPGTVKSSALVRLVLGLLLLSPGPAFVAAMLAAGASLPSDGWFGVAAGAFIFEIPVFIYMLPSLIAMSVAAPNWPATVALNVFLGWTGVGWFIALWMAGQRSSPSINTSLSPASRTASAEAFEASSGDMTTGTSEIQAIVPSRADAPSTFSADGNWWWDGDAWRAVWSSDGRWRWDGTRWLPT